MITLRARILKKNSICHFFDEDYIFVNEDDISSVSPDENGMYILTMKSGVKFVIPMGYNDLRDKLLKDKKQ